MTTTFQIRFQEPEVAELTTAMNALHARFGFVGEPIVSEIEVSVDFRPKKPSQEARDRMYGLLVRHHLPAVDLFTAKVARPRFSKARGAGAATHVLADRKVASDAFEQLIWQTEADRQASVDATYYVGPKHADRLWKIMDKVLDKQNPAAGTYTELPEDQRRTRIEVTLSRDALLGLGLDRLRDLPEFDFRGLQREFFSFRLMTCDFRSLGAHKALNAGVERYRIEKFPKTGLLGL